VKGGYLREHIGIKLESLSGVPGPAFDLLCAQVEEVPEGEGELLICGLVKELLLRKLEEDTDAPSDRKELFRL